MIMQNITVKKITLMFFLVLIMVVSSSADNNVLRDTLIKTLEITTDEDRLKAYDSIVNEIKSQAPAEKQPEQKKPSIFSWTYKEFSDPIDDTQKIVFSKYSEDTVDGTEKAILFIRYVNGKTDVFISWGRTLKPSPEDTVPVTIRFDKESAFQELWDIGNSYESTFSMSSNDFVQKLFDKSTMAVRTSGQKGILTVLFDITGFKQLAEKYNSQLNWIKQDEVIPETVPEEPKIENTEN